MKKIKTFLALIVFLISFSHDSFAYMFWNQACQFTGSSYISIPGSNSLDIMRTFTLEAWVCRDSDNPVNSTIMSKGSAQGYELGLALINFPNRIVVRTNGVNRLLSKAQVPENTWTHIAATYDSLSGTFCIYVNGSLDTSVIIANAKPIYSSDSLFIGKGANNFFKGKMDEVRIWKKALSATEVQRYRRTTLGTSSGIYNGLVCSMTFQYKTSFATNSLSLNDWSGTGNHGFLRNAVEFAVTVDLSNRPSTTISPNECIELDGTGDYLAGIDNSSVSPTEEITMEAWVYPKATLDGYIIHKGPAGGGAGTNYRLSFVAGILNATINGSSFNAPLLIFTNQWTHIAFTYKANTGRYKFYVNGRDTIGGFNLLGNIIDGNDSLRIGGSGISSPTTNFNGLIDEVRISKYEKTQAQIYTYLYQSIDNLNEPNNSLINVVYNFDGYTHDNANNGGPQMNFRYDARFSHPGTVNNQPVSPINRSDELNFSKGFVSKTSNKRIPETGFTGTTIDSLKVFLDETITDINVFVALNHTNTTAELSITLIGPNNDSIKIFSNNSLVTPADNIITIFDDQADSSIINSRFVSFGPIIKPSNNLNSVFGGDKAPGVWRISIRDQVGSGEGRLYAWGIQFNNMAVRHACLKLSTIIEGLYRSSIADNGFTLTDTIRCCLKKK